MKIARSFFVVLVLAIVVLSACSSLNLGTKPVMKKSTAASGKEPATNAGDKFKFGVMMPLTGGGAEYGIPLDKAIELAVDEINANGGISGKQIELVTEDSKCDPKEGATAAEKLVNVDGVKVIFGGACSGETLGALPITEAGKVLMMSPSATSPKLSGAGRYFVRLAPSDAGAGEVAAKFAYTTKGYRTIAIVSETTDYAQGLREVFTKSFTGLGGQIVADETFTTDATDFSTLLLKVNTKHPDAIYLVPQTPDKGVLLLKQLRQSGTSTPVLTAEVLIGRSIVKEHPFETDNIVGFEQAFDEKAGKSHDFVQAFMDAYNESLSFPFQAGAYDTVYLTKEAIEANNGELDTDMLTSYLHGLKGWEGAVGRVTIDEAGDPLFSYAVKVARKGVVSDEGTIRRAGVELASPTSTSTASSTSPSSSANMTEPEDNSTTDMPKNETANMTG